MVTLATLREISIGSSLPVNLINSVLNIQPVLLFVAQEHYIHCLKYHYGEMHDSQTVG